MFIYKKPPRSHALGEPLRHENHPRPRTRREFIAAGMLSGPAMVVGPAWLGALLKANRANAGAPPLDPDITALLAGAECNIPASGVGLPFICFDLAGGANLVGSEVIVGQQSGANVLNTQTNFLTTAGYGKLGVPGNMVPSSSANVNSSLGLLWHADGAIQRGITSMITPATAAGVNGAVICAMSQNDTQTNPHNPMYGIAMAGRKGQLLQLIGTQSSVSGGNSQAPMELIDPALQPSTITQPSDATSLVPIPPGGKQDPLSVAVMESQTRISGGTGLYNNGGGGTAAFSGALGMPTSLYTTAQQDAALKNQVRCSYVNATNTANQFGNPSALDPTQDANIQAIAAKFGANAFMDSDFKKTATVMKLVLNGFAAAGTITMGGYDYHDGTRATGETRNFKAGQMIGAVLAYASTLPPPFPGLMIYVFSDGSLNSNSMVDMSAAGRGKLGWQGDNSSVASTFFLAYSPKGRPALRGAAGAQQVGYFTADGSVVSTSSPAANSVDSLVQLVLLNYMGLAGTDAQFAATFPFQSLGSPAQLAAMTVFNPL